MTTLSDLANAALAARTATGMPIGTRASKGRVQVGHVGVDFKGRRFFDALSDWVSLSVAIETLQQITADHTQGE